MRFDGCMAVIALQALLVACSSGPHQPEPPAAIPTPTVQPRMTPPNPSTPNPKADPQTTPKDSASPVNFPRQSGPIAAR